MMRENARFAFFFVPWFHHFFGREKQAPQRQNLVIELAS
jgi:hypothetical protein